ncbi:MAG: acyl-CoA thioesterase [Flavobacteriales bacterium]|nr:acyl-CoA thioesterase [Flavobacteriales bacterium]
MRTKTPIQVRFNDVDMARHVHNAVYLSYFELARMDFLKRFIEPQHDWRGQGLILARNEVDYRKPVHLHDRVEVEAWCSNIGRRSFDLSYTLFIVADNTRTPAAQGRSVMVCYDYNAGTSIALPDAWRVELARIMEADA